ncbi:pyruvate dehydrogenase E1 component subunit alpha, putative [Plasmodium knowlesi strain H]|uniref:Pyruvate dehydrogenase E1 component subunit alpha, putative n=3 Tax=Plasmodium knowlesi TaxID=5850 RepID=A0A5K1UBU1_PLAKH|nr:pyruvate dehydrogenase E1 component subunit alpha, putative [Plasmodium knowlesi strain H]OTN65253.1 putative Pyruvate dehydrogenase E1 component subunit alpha [Plasmodium knowlesi]CAA9988270.1 pyruvate dehydrogenase E1 component subunit alpha, putative [Plasmodium knowlesi strain H]SBO20207.1 pyruvate dehydrogenase E1 component subunit alpha, putative [Plasmodium knowlesi strain H]SBO20415.1 pyruvate dehydrogenase E1 component subunit alpha, putative [Plasmodium knowlesi strain H]VVS77744.|eukprot:XP_002259247.1 pyruvate dehydrogenase alpha subunit, putative [Plasmodium knowlesi strain H]
MRIQICFFLLALILRGEDIRAVHMQRKSNFLFLNYSSAKNGASACSVIFDAKKVGVHHRAMKADVVGSKKVDEPMVKHFQLDERTPSVGSNKMKQNNVDVERTKEYLLPKWDNEANYNIYLPDNNMEDYLSDVKISKDEITMLYEDMHLGRMFENLVAKLYYSKRINGFVHLYNGQEAISSGIIKNLRASDFVTSTYRDHVHAISKNVPPKEVLNELYGNYYGSTNRGKGGSMHIYSKRENFIGGFGFIGEQIPIAVGLAYSILYKREFPLEGEIHPSGGAVSPKGNLLSPSEDSNVVVCFLGDGTANIGQFFESLNLAATYNLPIIFVIENNNWAIGMEGSRSSTDDLQNNYSKGKAFKIDTYKVDGNDVIGLYKLAKKKINQMRRRECGPVLIEAITYRAKGHSLADPDELRIQEEKASWKKRDPIIHLANYMKEKNIVDESFFEEIKKKTKHILTEAEMDANDNQKKSQTVNITQLLRENIYAPSERVPFQEDYNKYAKYDHLVDSELGEYYEALCKEMDRKLNNRKPDPSEHFASKDLPLVID